MEKLICSRECADLLGVKTQTLRAWRCRGTGPAFVRFGEGRFGRVVYRRQDLEAWVAGRVRCSTAEETAHENGGG